jgi:hypothetical protein
LLNGSEKDATVAGERTRSAYEREFESSKEKDDNAKFISLNRAHIDALAVSSSEEAIALLLASERILDDLELALEDSSNWNQHLVVRKWIDMPLAAEFRGFVVKGKLTALSQYFAPCFFANLQGREEQLAAQCRQLLEKICHLIPSSVVCDFAVLEHQVLVIEINPFNDYEGCGTSACMFDWKKDRQILDG